MNRNERIAVFVENPRLLDASPKVIQRVLGRGAMEVRSIRDAKAVARRHLFLMDSAQPLSDSALPGRAG